VAIYSLGLRSTVSSKDNAVWCALSPTGNDAKIIELRWINGASASAVIGLGRSGNTPTLTSAVTFLAEDEARPAGLTTASSTFGTAPTVPTAFHRIIFSPTTTGFGIIWTFQQGLVMQGGGPGIVLWNMSQGSTVMDIDCVVSE
jgi:hypothetical protein